MTEVWVLVTGRWAGYRYSVSNLGRVYSHCRPGKGVGRKTGRLLKPFPDKNGYLRGNLYDENRIMSQVPVHTLVAEAFISLRPQEMTVNHKDADKTNNIVDNLEWISSQENTAHATALGLMKSSTAKRLETRRLKLIYGG